ncbi:MAG TPA: OmpA family protein [Enhygromyxa sp.]|nr:OmpA family protein [Enhygromyxa sp.]
MNIRLIGIATLCSLLVPAQALAGSPEDDSTESSTEPDADGEPEAGSSVEAGASLSLGGDGAEASGDAKAERSKRGGHDKRTHLPWIKRWAPEPMMGEWGIYGGVLLPNPAHELFSPDLSRPDQGFKPLGPVAPDLGLRGGFYPLRFFGVEAEAGVMLPRLEDGSGNPLMYTVRGHLVGQLGLWSVTPFVLVGAGALGVASSRDLLGNDVDPALHFGGGLKFYINRYVALRIDVRDVVSYKQEVENVFIGHNPEFLLGLTITTGRKKDQPKPQPQPRAKPSDRDGDGIVDESDACPDQAETVNGYQDTDGCPESDQDGDGFYDDQDSCPAEAETVNGYQDEDGCPESDRDGDGFYDDQDSCPDEPETDNGYQDEDGCPDEVPREVQEFTGTIKGITFDNNQATIRSSSTPTLDKAVEVLKANPDIRIKISGHTDSKGDRNHNLDLSSRRAESVKNYLVEHGIDESRILTEGLGPDKPIDSNDTKAGRANNRRIEFEIVRRTK